MKVNYIHCVACGITLTLQGVDSPQDAGILPTSKWETLEPSEEKLSK